MIAKFFFWFIPNLICIIQELYFYLKFLFFLKFSEKLILTIQESNKRKLSNTSGLQNSFRSQRAIKVKHNINILLMPDPRGTIQLQTMFIKYFPTAITGKLNWVTAITKWRILYKKSPQLHLIASKCFIHISAQLYVNGCYRQNVIIVYGILARTASKTSICW